MKMESLVESVRTHKDTYKTATSFVVSAGIRSIVTGVVSSNVPQGNFLQRGLVWAGKEVIASMINVSAKQHTDSKIDAVFVWYDDQVTVQEKKGNNA